MSAKAISELSGKEVLYRYLECGGLIDAPTAVRVCAGDNFDAVVKGVSWLSAAQVSRGCFKFTL